MKQVYDILVNFKKHAYEFYEWEKNDEIEHIKVIPLVKVSSSNLLDFINNEVLVDRSFLESIKDKTEILDKRMIKIIDYACILFDKHQAVAFEFDSNGKIIGRSKLLFDEADDAILLGINLKEQKIDYNIISKLKNNSFYTRKEVKTVDNLLKYLDKICYEKKFDEMKYMYYECYDFKEDNVDKAYNVLKESISNLDFKVINKLCGIIKVLKK